MDLGLAHKRVLVCGGSRGIGFAAAEDFVREGARVVICGRDSDSINRATTTLGHGTAGIVADLATMDGLDHVGDRVQSLHGGIDVLITNTGGPPTFPALGADWAAWEQASNLLLRSAVEICRTFVPGMRERKWGRVIGITSFAVKRPVQSLVLSNALRAAVTGFFRTLADEVAADNVTVNSVLPGYTATERLEHLADANSKRTGSSRDEVYAQWLAETPAQRLGRPDELSATIAFLASERAGFITGQALCVDGGAVRTLL